MELFDKRFVHFMWDDELKGKVCIVAANMRDLISGVENDGNGAIKTNALHYSGDETKPFHPFLLGKNCFYRFAYYDPNYSIKKAFNEGKTIQFKLINGVWEDILCEGDLIQAIEENIAVRVKPECPCEDGIDSKACAGCPQDEARKQTFRPFKNCDELVEFWSKNYQTGFRPAYTKPLIWIRCKDVGTVYLITGFDNDRAGNHSCVLLEDIWLEMKTLFEKYEFLDGSPVGMEVEG